MSPGISLIIPLYNSSPFLEKLFQSILQQDYPYFEVIFIDDGSIDATREITSSFCKKCPSRYRLYSQNNRGLNPARKTGIDLARYDLLAFSDGDDYFNSDYLSAMASQLGDADIVCAPIIAETVQEKAFSILNRSEGRVESWDTNTAITKLLQNFEVSNFLPGKLYRKTLFKGVDFSFHDPFEDYTVSHIIFSKAKKILKIPKPSYHYVKRPGSLSAPNPASYRACITAMLIRKKWFENNFPSRKDYSELIYDSLFDRFIQLLSLEYVSRRDHLYHLVKKYYYIEGKNRRMNRYIRRNVTLYLFSPRLYWLARKSVNKLRRCP